MNTLTNSSEIKIDPEYIGYVLLKKGFRDWFLYMFKVINGSAFIIEPLHEELFKQFERIYNKEEIRVNINVCPRSAKTTMSKYFLVYGLTINPKSNFIYTSYSQDLLGQIAKEVGGIMNHPAYLAMYPSNRSIESVEELSGVDDFWREYFREQNGKETFTSKKITTRQGGVVLFASIGSAITGFGVSVRTAQSFAGCLIIDDANKSSDIMSEIMRKKVHQYFADTLFTRLNESNAPVINIQQRLHLDDLSGFLSGTYKFKTFKFPLLDEQGKCNLPNQYNDERVKELQLNNYVFSAQYQQEPIVKGGGVFKREWWRFYKDDNLSFTKVYFTADTAFKTNEWNDYTAILVWGLTGDKKLFLLDMVHGKFEAPELEATFLALWDKWKGGVNNRRPIAVYIEDKASGTGLIQSLRRKGGLPIVAFTPEKDKLTRAYEALPYIASGNVYLPENENNDISRVVLAEADSFNADGTHSHDDIVDCITAGVKYAYQQRGLF